MVRILIESFSRIRRYGHLFISLSFFNRDVDISGDVTCYSLIHSLSRVVPKVYLTVMCNWSSISFVYSRTFHLQPHKLDWWSGVSLNSQCNQVALCCLFNWIFAKSSQLKQLEALTTPIGSYNGLYYFRPFFSWHRRKVNDSHHHHLISLSQ